MPNLNGMGPMGKGQRTGCGGGFCGGCMCGRGFGFRRFFSSKNEIASLEDQEKMLEEELIAIREEKSALIKESK
jgi:hypothetical protein